MYTKLIYAILFLKGKDGININELGKLLNLTPGKLKLLLNNLNKYLNDNRSPLILKFRDNNVKFTLSQEISLHLAKTLNKDISINLSNSLLETLTIIAYNQPTTKSLVEKIRGVKADYALNRLMDFKLIEILGKKSNQVGTPFLYVTTHNFLDLFGLKTIYDLPPLKIKDKTLNVIKPENLFSFEKEIIENNDEETSTT